MKQHKLKSFTKIFPRLVSGEKRSEVRVNDRGFEVGDVVTFQEGQLENGEFVYTGRTISGVISHIDDYGCQFGFVNLSLSRMGLMLAGGEDE